MYVERRNIGVVLNVRTGSSRCKNKLLKNFSDTTLFDIALKKLEAIQCSEKLVCYHDSKFLRSSNVKFAQRSEASVNVDGPLSLVFECINSLSSEYFMFLNPSCAFFETTTIQKALDFFAVSSCQSLTSVVRNSDWIFYDQGVPLSGDFKSGDTKKTSVYRVAHVFHIFPVSRILSDELIWSGKIGDPFLFEIPKNESFDIDDEVDFSISECLYRNLNNLDPT